MQLQEQSQEAFLKTLQAIASNKISFNACVFNRLFSCCNYLGHLSALLLNLVHNHNHKTESLVAIILPFTGLHSAFRPETFLLLNRRISKC